MIGFMATDEVSLKVSPTAVIFFLLVRVPLLLRDADSARGRQVVS